LFATGQQIRALGSARADRLRAEFDAALLSVQSEVETAVDVFARRAAVVKSSPLQFHDIG